MIFICFTIVDFPDSPDPKDAASVHRSEIAGILEGSGEVDRRAKSECSAATSVGSAASG